MSDPIQALLDAAANPKLTAGPWSVNADKRYEVGQPAFVWGPEGPGHGIVCEMPPEYPRHFVGADAAFIAAARNAARALVEEWLSRGVGHKHDCPAIGMPFHANGTCKCGCAARRAQLEAALEKIEAKP